MNTVVEFEQGAGAEYPRGETEAEIQIAAPPDSDTEHSQENILRWAAYLPEECIKTMIEMGWDKST